MNNLGGVLATLLSLYSLASGPNYANKIPFGDKPLAQPLDWKVVDQTPDLTEQRILVAAIKHTDTARAALTNLATAVSDPDSPRYGKYVTVNDLSILLTPPLTWRNAVTNWLTASGLTSTFKMNLNGDFVLFAGTLEAMQKEFGVTFNVYQHISGTLYTATLGPYYVPVAVAPYLDFISGLVGFPEVVEIHSSAVVKNTRAMSKESESSNHTENRAKRWSVTSDVTPTVVRNSFGIPGSLYNTYPNNSNGLVELQGNYYSMDDITIFFQRFVPYYTGTLSIFNTHGINLPDQPSLESSLDAEYMMSTAPGAQTYIWSFPRSPFFGDLVLWLLYVSNQTQIPYVFSLSYGSQDSYPAKSERDRFDVELMKLAARGTSVIVASGDQGSGCSETGLTCKFYPSFPATSAWMTSVGAVMYTMGTSGTMVAASQDNPRLRSGGGFSPSGQEAPSWQRPFIANWLSTNPNIDPLYFNARGRCTPDISALGMTFVIISNASEAFVVGTSAAAPVFAGLVTLLNQVRLQAGYTPLGFLNPWLYKSAANPGAFIDINQGDNNWPCGTCNPQGFQATVGYDPVTGLGVPQYPVLAKLVPKK